MTTVGEKQGQYAEAVIQIIAGNSDGNEFALTIIANAYQLLARFTVYSEDDQVFQECFELFSTQFANIKEHLKEILNEDLRELKEYIQAIDEGDLLTFQEIGQQLSSESVSHLRGLNASLPSISLDEVPLIHQLFYGYSLQCSTFLDLLISQLKAASVISYCKSRHEIWLLVLDLFQASQMPILDLNENFFRIIKNWCSLIRYCIAGSFHIFQKLIPSLKEKIYGKLIDFSLEHIQSLSVLLSTLNVVQGEEFSNKLLSLIDSVNLTINKCLTHGAIDVFLSVSKIESHPINQHQTYHEKIIASAQNVISALDVEQMFHFLKRILSLITPFSAPHSSKNCSNYMLWKIFCDIFSTLKCDSSNWLDYHLTCYYYLPHSFCRCIPPQNLWNNLFLPVTGKELEIFSQLVPQQFNGNITADNSLDGIKAELSLTSWLDSSTEKDCLKIISIVEAVLYVFDSVQQQNIFLSLIELCENKENDQIKDELFKIFKRKMKQESCFHQSIRKLVVPNFAELFISPILRSSFFEFLSVAIKNLDLPTRSSLIETSIQNFSNLLKRALVDIWTFVSPSAEIFYHGLCDLLEWYSKVFDLNLFQDSTSKKVASDCVRLGMVCIDAIELSSDNLSMNGRITELISLSLRCLSDDKKSFELLKKKINEIKMETNSTLISLATKCLQKATECKKLLNNGHVKIAGDIINNDEEEESDDEKEIKNFILPKIRIKPCQNEIENEMAFLGMELIKKFLTNCHSIDENDEMKLQQFFGLLNPKLFQEKNGIFNKITQILFECSDAVSTISPQPKMLKTKILETTASFVAQNPSPKSLSQFLPACFNGSQALTDVAKALQTLLREQFVQPSECLQMPQRAFSSADRPDPAPIPSRLTPFSASCFVLDPAHKIFLSEGMTISFWLSLAKFSDLKIKEHVVSIGTEQLNVKIFIHASTGTLSFTLNVFGATIKRIKTSKVFQKEKTWESICLGIKVVDKAAKVTVLFGDHLTCLESPDLPPDINVTTTPLEICIGSAIESDFIYELSSIFAFKGLLSSQSIIAYRSLGCEFQCLTECRSGEYYSCFATSMTKNLITDKTCNLLEVWSEPKKFISKLQRSILFVIRATSAHCYGLSVFQKGIDNEKLSQVRENVFCLAMYKDYPIEWHCQIVYRKQETLDISLRAIGSIKLFLFIYALSVDKNYNAEAQLSALKLLFQALRRSPLYYGEFRASHGLHVLTQIMNTKTSKINDEIFDELCNFLFSELEPNSHGQLCVSFYTVIMEPEFLKTLFSTTDLWKFEYFRYWARLVQLTATTLDTCKAKFCEFNSQILHRVDFLTPILHALLDMYSNKNHFSASSLVSETGMYDSRDSLTLISKSIVSSLCTIVSELVSSPYRCPAVVQLWNFILLSHPAQDTYLDYTLKGHAEWVRSEDIESAAIEDSVIEPPQNSLLSSFFEKVLMNFDKDKIAELWKETNSATSVRKEILKSDNDYRIFSPAATRLDSIVCDQQHSGAQDYWSSDESGAAQFEQASQPRCPDHWLISLRADLISSMCHIILACEDSLMAVIELDVITWKTIIVQLTNQTHMRIRNLIFMLLQNFFLRCTDKYRQEFIKQHGFLLLANHLRKMSVTYEIADSLFSIFCGECVKIRDGLDEEHLESISNSCFRYASFHSLFALLEASVTDHALFWTVCSTLQKIFVSNNLLRRAMIDCGIVDTMMNVLRLLCVEQPSVQTMVGPVFPLLDCWISFSRSIINLVIPCRDPYMYSRSEDFIWLCQIADYQLSNSFVSTTPSERLRKFSSLSAPPSMGCSNCAKQMVRRALCGLLDCWFDSIQSVVVDSSKMIPVDERYEDEDSEGSDSSAFEIYHSDSHYTSTSYYGDESKAEKRRRFEFANAEELSKRLLFGLEMTNNLFVFGQIPESMSEKEEMLFQSYIEILLAPWKKRQTGEYHEEWCNVLSGCRERARVLLAQLIAYVLFPVQIRQKQLFLDPLAVPQIDEQGLLRRRLLIVKSLAGELSNNKMYLESLLEVNLDYQYGMKIALHELALCPQYYEIWDEYSEDLERMIKFLRTMQLESPLANLTRDEIRALSMDEVILLHTYNEKRSKFVEVLKKEALRLSEKDNSLIKAVCDNAMVLTCSIAELQNEPRKFYIQSRKDAINACAKANEVLANLVIELCHPEAPFFDEKSWPKGYSLDTTENLRRERKRLKPDHYRFEKKFLKKFRQDEIGDTATNPAPLQLLRESCPNFATTDYIEASNAVRLSLSATLIRTAFECSGEIIISERKIHFLGEEAKSTQKGSKCSPVTFAWSYNQLSEIYYRFYLLKDTALELFTTTGDAFLINFANTVDRDENFIGQLKKMGLRHLMADEESQLKLVNQLWRRGNITNFDYLMTLNKLAGRSFNDLMQYPVFPFILSDYRSAVLDLNLSQSYRDLAKPMAIQNKQMEEYYIHNYESLSEENKRIRREGETFASACFGAYHYGSHYSNTGIVAHYLVRLSPFTNVALEYQDNNFDIPDRLFNSIDTTWRLSASESTTDFKELIPEFFFLPEMFCNREKLELGVRQAGIEVDDVNLPPWCQEQKARLFCAIHRQALESSYVTNNLHSWIDLIFGFKQQGAAAIKAINVFHPATYRGKDLEHERFHDEISLSALKTMVRTYGQMPNQMFFSPHLPHLNVSRRPSGDGSSLLSSVKGLRWGDFVGSPDLDRKQWLLPILNANISTHDSIGRLFAIHREGFCYGLPDKTELVLRLNVDNKDPLRRSFETSTTAVVSWKFTDNILRIKLIQMNDSVWINLIDLQMFELTQVVFSPNADLLYIGTSCGLIRSYSVEYKNDTKIWHVKLANEFFAHKASIKDLKVCDDFHIMLSTSIDGMACLWDSNKLMYIRTLKPPIYEVDETITFTSISSISADIAIVYQSGKGSRLVLFTVNGEIIGSYESGSDLTISSIAMTNLEEGTGINCIAIGLQNGVIRLLDTWTLSFVCDISVGTNEPVISIEFTCEGRRLYAALASGKVLCWQALSPSSPSSSSSGFRPSKAVPSFRMLNPFV